MRLGGVVAGAGMLALGPTDAHTWAQRWARVIRWAQVRGCFAQGWASGVHRLYFGAMTRSVRCGGAGVLYFGYRRLNGGGQEQPG